MKRDNCFLLAMLFFLIVSNLTIMAQSGMVERWGGGAYFSAEQYKIDQMKNASKPNTNYPVYTTPYQPVKKAVPSSSSYDPGSGYMKSTKEWRRKELKLDYRKYAKKAKSKEKVGLSFEYPDKNGVEVTHANEGISAYNTPLFHNHDKEYDNYNNILYDLYYSLPLNNNPNFGFGLQFIGRNSSFHECKEYTFFSFFITADGRLLYLKKKLPEAKTSGFFGALSKDVPEMFNIEKYTSIPINAELKDLNLLTVNQWKNKLCLGINNDIIYEDKLSWCPVSLLDTPYNLFLNKGTVKFFEGGELYTEKKH